MSIEKERKKILNLKSWNLLKKSWGLYSFNARVTCNLNINGVLTIAFDQGNSSSLIFLMSITWATLFDDNTRYYGYIRLEFKHEISFVFFLASILTSNGIQAKFLTYCICEFRHKFDTRLMPNFTQIWCINVNAFNLHQLLV